MGREWKRAGHPRAAPVPYPTVSLQADEIDSGVGTPSQKRPGKLPCLATLEAVHQFARRAHDRGCEKVFPLGYELDAPPEQVEGNGVHVTRSPRGDTTRKTDSVAAGVSGEFVKGWGPRPTFALAESKRKRTRFFLT